MSSITISAVVQYLLNVLTDERVIRRVECVKQLPSSTDHLSSLFLTIKARYDEVPIESIPPSIITHPSSCQVWSCSALNISCSVGVIADWYPATTIYPPGRLVVPGNVYALKISLDIHGPSALRRKTDGRSPS